MGKLTKRQIALLKRAFLDYQQTSEFIKHPLFIDNAEGLYYWDADGKRYFDAIGGIFVATLGHRHPRLVEAMQRQMGKLTFAPPLHGTTNVALDHKVILIYDEIITGFGKTGSMFAAQTFDVIPDIICTGKGLSSGMLPMGAMIAREEMADAFYGPLTEKIHFAHGHTFAGNPLACAVGIAVIDEIIEHNLCEKARELGEYLVTKLETLTQYGVVREIRGKGILQGVELVRDTRTMEAFPELGNALKRTALTHGLIMRIDPSWFAVAPPLIAEESDIDEMCELIEKSLVDALNMVT